MLETFLTTLRSLAHRDLQDAATLLAAANQRRDKALAERDLAQKNLAALRAEHARMVGAGRIHVEIHQAIRAAIAVAHCKEVSSAVAVTQAQSALDVARSGLWATQRRESDLRALCRRADSQLALDADERQAREQEDLWLSLHWART